jgi:hypothetical protein
LEVAFCAINLWAHDPWKALGNVLLALVFGAMAKVV